MKKLLFFLFVIPSALSAQHGTSSLDIVAGPSNAMGQLSAAIPGGGYASSGGHFAINYINIKEEKALGWAFLLDMGKLHIKQGALKREMEMNGVTPTFNDSSYWTVGGLMAGPVWRKSTGKFFADVRLLGGLYFGDAPWVRVTDPQKLSKEQRMFRNETADCFAGLGAMLSLNAGYYLNEKVFLTTGYNIYASRPTFKISEPARTGEFPSPGYTHHYTVTSVISQFQLGVGFSW